MKIFANMVFCCVLLCVLFCVLFVFCLCFVCVLFVFCCVVFCFALLCFVLLCFVFFVVLLSLTNSTSGGLICFGICLINSFIGLTFDDEYFCLSHDIGFVHFV